MLYCPNYSTALHTTGSGSKEGLVYRARCKQWSCAYCAEINRRVWRARIMLEVEKSSDQSWYFWTITLDGSDHGKGTAHSLQVWREHWDNLMKRVRRDVKTLRYVRVFEAHKTGTLHVHMLADKTYDDVTQVIEDDGRDNWRSDTLKAHLTALKLGWRHDVRPIITVDFEENGNARNVSAYVCKYLTKSIQSNIRERLRDAGMSRVRMIQTSRGWSNVPTSDNQRVWDVGGVTFEDYDKLVADGGVLIDAQTKHAVKTSDYHGEPIYPNRYSDLSDMASEATLDK